MEELQAEGSGSDSDQTEMMHLVGDVSSMDGKSNMSSHSRL